MITSHGEEQKVISALRNGAANYILKPIQVDKMTDVLTKLFI